MVGCCICIFVYVLSKYACGMYIDRHMNIKYSTWNYMRVNMRVGLVLNEKLIAKRKNGNSKTNDPHGTEVIL